MAPQQWTPAQNKLHEIAELARQLNLEEDNPIITESSKLWWFEQNDMRILANTVYYEANGCTDRHQQLVAQVVLNRVKRSDYPNTIYDVIVQPNQYNSMYVRNLPSYFNCEDEMKRCFENAYKAFIGEVECPKDVVFQSNFPQLGTGYYEIIEVSTPYFHSTSYFSYG